MLSSLAGRNPCSAHFITGRTNLHEGSVGHMVDRCAASVLLCSAFLVRTYVSK